MTTPENTMNTAEQAAFDMALELWKRDSVHYSSTTQIKNHEGYRTLIALGEKAIVPLLEELAEFPWVGICVALYQITEATLNIGPKDYGKVGVVAEAWLDWGHDNRHLRPLKFHRLIVTLEESLS